MFEQPYSSDMPAYSESVPDAPPPDEPPLEPEIEAMPRRSRGLLIALVAVSVLFIATLIAGAYLVYDRENLRADFTDMSRSALTIAGIEQSGPGQLIRRYVSNGQFSEAAAAMTSAAAEKQPAGDAGPLGAILGQIAGGAGAAAAANPAAPNANARRGFAGRPGGPNPQGAPGAPGAARGGGIDPEVAKMVPPEYRQLAQSVLGGMPPEQQKAMVSRFLGGARPPSGAPAARASVSAPQPGQRGSGRRSQLASRVPSAPSPTPQPQGRPRGEAPRPGGGQPPDVLNSLLGAIPPGINPDMIKTLITSASKPEDKGAASALAAFVLARQLTQADFDKFGPQLAQIMLAGLNTTTPATLADMARRFGPFLGGAFGGPGGRGGRAGGPGMRQGAPDEATVRESLRQLAREYYAARGQGKDVSSVDEALDAARTKLYSGDYAEAMRATRRAREALDALK